MFQLGATPIKCLNLTENGRSLVVFVAEYNIQYQFCMFPKENLIEMEERPSVNLRQRMTSYMTPSRQEKQSTTHFSHVIRSNSNYSIFGDSQNPLSSSQEVLRKLSNCHSTETGLQFHSGSSTPPENQEIESKKNVFQRQTREGAEICFRATNKCKETQNSKNGGQPKVARNRGREKEKIADLERQRQQYQNEVELQRRGKKQQKHIKKLEKNRINYSELNQNSYEKIEKISTKTQQNLSGQLLQIFQHKYPYYLNGKTIVYPIQDSLFLTFTELKESPAGRGYLASKNHFEQENLPPGFTAQLQIWNLLKQHPTFFQLKQDMKLSEVTQVLHNHNSPIFRQLFKALHLFYIRDIIHHRYDESSSQEYHSFISLWKYAEENSVIDKLFVTCWNKLIQLYISINKNNYNDVKTKETSEHYSIQLKKAIAEGSFDPPQPYNELLAYMLFLINMCFETHTFRTLINDKMLFFRDNNKMKNEMLEEKKDIEGLLWDIKQQQKNLTKKEKNIIKNLKKEQKSVNVEDETTKLNIVLEEIEAQRKQIIQKRQSYLNQINSIQNSIYELSCMPEFSNVWFLGQDKHRNLYWFINEYDHFIFRESYEGRWSKISNKNIDILQNTLNMRGIKQNKLYQKIAYYKQLGYLKTEAQDHENKEIENQDVMQEQINHEPFTNLYEQVVDYSHFSQMDIQSFSYLGYGSITPAVIKILILKSELMITKYLYERNSKWTSEENRHSYLKRINEADIDNLEALTQDLRMFNQKICVVQINIKQSGLKGDASDTSKTRKIQTKIWGINEKYKHFWYDYSRKCKNQSDLYFLVSILYLTIQKYVTKTRKPNNTKYFFKTVEFENGEGNEGCCGQCQSLGDLQMCNYCDTYLHIHCMAKHESSECKRKQKNQ